MARALRIESEGGVYHVLNRGNDRKNIFATEGAKGAFLNCLGEACERTGWRVHAWCIMSNHYHVALATPRANLVDGMKWLQGTFAMRYNLHRHGHGHIFQGRYKALIVDPDEALGPVCHYIHLNPVRAGICTMKQLAAYRWSSLRWLCAPKLRPSWYEPSPALSHAGGLADTPAGGQRYREYLAWLAENEPERRRQRFEELSRGWIIGGNAFTRSLVAEHRELVGQGPRLAMEIAAAREQIWQEELSRVLRQLRHDHAALQTAGKSVDWKLAAAAALKSRTTVTNRWLGHQLVMGNLHEVSRKVAAWLRRPDRHLLAKIKLSPNPKRRPS